MAADVASDAALGAQQLVTVCADLRPGEEAVVVCDPGTAAVAAEVAAAARTVGADVNVIEIAPLAVHGAEPPGNVAEAIAGADVVFGLTAMSMAHSAARLAATDNGARYLSLPDYSLALLAARSLRAPFRALTAVSEAIAAVFTAGDRAVLQTGGGRGRLELVLTGRTGNAAPGWCAGPGTLASPPDAEANVAVVEHASEGTLVVDGSVPHPRLGVLDSPLVLTVRGGMVVAVEGDRADVLEALLDAPGDPAARIVAELGVGLNAEAELTGRMLEDEGAAGTAHVGIGANATVGGTNQVASHIDHVVRRPTLSVDGVTILQDGRLISVA